MENKSSYIHVGEGVLRGFMLTLLALLIYSVVLKFATFSEGVSSMFILVVTLISILYGAIFSARKINKKGWLVGATVGLLYIVIIYLVALVAGGEATLAIKDLIRVTLAVIVGGLSGMLGINI
jgi:putative membrane protein (TIGR04086 family)